MARRPQPTLMRNMLQLTVSIFHISDWTFITLCVQFSLCALYYSSQKQTHLFFSFYIVTDKNTKNEKKREHFSIYHFLYDIQRLSDINFYRYLLVHFSKILVTILCWIASSIFLLQRNYNIHIIDYNNFQ